VHLHAILFPGQEFQNINVLKNLIRKYKIIKNTFYESSEYIGFNLNRFIKNNSQEIINNSKYIRLIAITSSIAMYRLWNNANEKIPIILAGHSLGEYSALVCSNSLKFSDAIKLILIRHQFMKESMKKKMGAMHVIIGLKEHNIEKILENFKHLEQVSIACINTPHHIVISGEKNIVHEVSLACKKNGAKKIFYLPINPPSHCILMKSAAKKFLKVLETIVFETPKFPVINNVDVKCETTAPAIRNALMRQLYNPVKWCDTITYLSKKNVSIFVEAGLNNTLININKFIVAIPSVSLNNKNYLLNQSFKKPSET